MLGIGMDASDQPYPVRIATGPLANKIIVDAKTSSQSSMVITSDGKVYAFGNDLYKTAENALVPEYEPAIQHGSLDGTFATKIAGGQASVEFLIIASGKVHNLIPYDGDVTVVTGIFDGKQPTAIASTGIGFVAIMKECPDGWSSRDNSTCFRLFTDSKNWTSAQQQCQKFGAHLAVLRSASESQYIRVMHSNMTGISDIWFGLIRDASNKWSWFNDNKSAYRNWMNYYPRATDRCAGYSTTEYDMKWKSSPCDQKKPYYCQINL
jgi:hypothetical protein